jgi:LmbE family N-acetylglucosaminyl deacetylase
MQPIGIAGTTPLRVLAIGAHPDDIEIGAGGTILRLADEGRIVAVTWAVFSGDPTRAAEARSSADQFLAACPSTSVLVHDFRDGFLPYEGGAVKERVEELKAVEPDLILTHRLEDRHQDHRLLAELTWNAFRDHVVLEYEIPKYDGDVGPMNAYAELSEPTVRRKLGLLMAGFPSQLGRPWFREETFAATLRLRGMECNAGSGYAEAFTARKLKF